MTGAARRTQVVWIVDFYQVGGLKIIGVDNAAIVLMVLAAQECIHLPNKSQDMLGIRRLFRPRLAQCVEVPAATAIEAVPESGKLIPGKQAVKGAVEQRVEFRIIEGLHGGPKREKVGHSTGHAQI